MDAADTWKVDAILSLLKRTPVECLHIAGLTRPDSKTYRFITSLGYTVGDVYRCLLDLEVADYVAGPLADDKGRPHDLWVFGKVVEGSEAYIKFTVFVSNGCPCAVCVSFHEAQRPLAYPYKKV